MPFTIQLSGGVTYSMEPNVDVAGTLASPSSVGDGAGSITRASNKSSSGGTLENTQCSYSYSSMPSFDETICSLSYYLIEK